VIVVVVDAAQVRDVLFGGRGVVQAARLPAAVLLCPTIGPADVENAAGQLAAHGIACIDAPISGGPARARDGTMSLMVACDDALFDRHQPLLRTLGSRLFRVGTRPGDGARTKLVNNLLAAVNLAGTAEAIALAERLGLDAHRTLDVIAQSSGQSWIGSDRMARALQGDFAPRAHTTLLAKDSVLAMAMARAAGIEPLLGAQAAALFRAACDAGFAGDDDASLLRYLRAGAGKPPAG
jgi:L-threonate 2-dehydrogenase